MPSILVNTGHIKPLDKVGRKRVTTSPKRIYVSGKNNSMDDLKESPKATPTFHRASLYKNTVQRIGVSICVTAYKTSQYIEECLDSIEKQSYFINNNNYEVLLGVDGCKETLEKVVEIQSKYRNLKVFMMNENVGTYITTNTLIANAKYPWIIRFDSDDIMLPNMVSTLMMYTDKADIVRFKLENFPTGTHEITHGQILVRKSILDEYGYYMPWKCAADTELITRLTNVARIIRINTILMKRRIHPESLTNRSDTSYKSELREQYKYYINEMSTFTPKIDTVTAAYTEMGKYPSYGKRYNGEKGIISLTSWRERIHTVYKTIDSLNECCSDFHVVLCLSSDEFTEGVYALSPSITERIKENRFELIMVKPNVKAFKKVLFTMDKYQDYHVPIISADDDCLYICDYATELYNKWKENENNVVRYNMYNPNDNWYYTQGPSTLYPPEVYRKHLLPLINRLGTTLTRYNEDDQVFTQTLKSAKIPIVHVYRGTKFAFKFHDETGALHNNRLNPMFASCY